MLKPTDFRINNLVQDDLGNLLKVLRLDGEKIHLYVVDRSKFPLEVGWKPEPIQITEEWYQKIKENYFECDNYNICISEVDVANRYNFSNSFNEPDIRYFIILHERHNNIEIEITEMHHAQNTWHSITNGEELKIMQG